MKRFKKVQMAPKYRLWRLFHQLAKAYSEERFLSKAFASST
jgi:hypothetical protein